MTYIESEGEIILQEMSIRLFHIISLYSWLRNYVSRRVNRFINAVLIIRYVEIFKYLQS